MDVWEFNLRSLRVFVETVRLGSLIAASRAAGMSQPAASQSIARLEEQLGVDLFTRSAQGMHPSPAAEMLCERARAALGCIASNRVTAAQARAFAALARSGGYAAARQETGLAEASLHRAVRDLEIAVSRKLTIRRGRGVELTRAGKQLARQFLLAAAEMRAGLSEIDELVGAGAGEVRIGAMPLSRARALPEAIVAFQAARPGDAIAVAEGSFAELIEPLRDGELDLLLGAAREPGPGPDIAQEPLFEDSPVITARAGHPLARKRGHAPLEALAAQSWIVPRPGTPLRDNWELLFQSAGLDTPEIAVECGSFTMIRTLLLQTDCLSILSLDQTALERQAGQLAVLGPAPPALRRMIVAYTRADWRPTPGQAAFLDILRTAAGH